MFENGQSSSSTTLTFFFYINVYFFNSTWFLQWPKRLREADFKDPLLHVAQSDGSKKNRYLIIINPAYVLKNITHHIVNYSSWYVFYARTNCTLFKKLLHEKHLERTTPNLIIECFMYREFHSFVRRLQRSTYIYSAIACYEWYSVTRYKADGSGIIQYHFHLWYLTPPPFFPQYQS